MDISDDYVPRLSDPETRPIRVVLVDDHEMVAAGLAAALGDEPDIEVVGVAMTLATAEEVVGFTKPDVVVMDYGLPDGDGAEGTRRVRRLSPATNVVMLTATTDDHALADALGAGCCGFISKGGPLADLIHAVKAAANGDAAFPADVVAMLAQLGTQSPAAIGAGLSIRELEVLRALGEGRSTAAIALTLGLSEHTVRNHVSSILTKLDAHTKLQAVVIAARAGLIDVFKS
jgi:DNA-binding NarL/FixJ family response regulator